jgi:hypothetical protein
MQQDLGVKLIHVVLAFYHDDGSCDSAKLLANKKLNYWLLDNNKTVKDIETVRRVFDSTKNHQNARL